MFLDSYEYRWYYQPIWRQSQAKPATFESRISLSLASELNQTCLTAIIPKFQWILVLFPEKALFYILIKANLLLNCPFCISMKSAANTGETVI